MHYIEHAPPPYIESMIDSEISFIRHFIKIQFVNKVFN